ncbi:MAG: hypothetical protein OSB21_10320, partial [Myxococcota bacterium]|nr:hypothetical protein [Myxococcota bacterium]
MRALLGLAALFSVACESPDKPFAELLKVTDRAQLIGGPGAQGAVGDYLLHNDKIRVIIHGRAGNTGSSTTFGATILDADLQRPQTEFGGAMGRDSLFELGPLVSLGVIKPTDSSAFSIVRSSQSDDGGALLRIEGPMGHIVDTLKLFAVVPELDVPNLWFRIDYELRAGENFVRMTVDAFLDGQPEEGAEVVEQSPVVGSEPFMSILKGSITNDPTNPACATDEDCGASERCMTVMGNSVCRSETAEIGGAFGGWLALMGKKVSNFAPGNGFDPWLSLKAAAANGSDFFANPSPIAFMGGAGDRVSYALYTEGDLLVPVSTSAFTMAFSHEVHCTLDDPDCLKGKALRMRGYFAVGEGDIASATEGLIALRELPNAELSGVVLNQRDGLPVSKADVVVFSDPWAAATDDEVSNRSYAELIAAQRSASIDAINTAGSAGVITHMRSDVGSDPILDGAFSGKVALLSGSPQRVFLVARKGEQISAPVMVKLAPGESA